MTISKAVVVDHTHHENILDIFIAAFCRYNIFCQDSGNLTFPSHNYFFTTKH